MPRLGVVALAAVALGAQTPSLDTILASAARYVDEYQRAFSAVVSEEEYRQTYRGAGARNGREDRILTSDVLLIHERAAGWVTFRDVFKVDGNQVRDRQDRLVNLILKPAPSTHEQITRVANESARFNLGPGSRTMNTPALALMFLGSEIQPRLGFTLARLTKFDGQAVAEVEFTERGMPRLVATADNAAATGKFWIEPVSGRVLKTEISIRSSGVHASITVTYRAQEKLGMFVPVLMVESYQYQGLNFGGNISGTSDNFGQSTGAFRIEGHASYTNFRRFAVDTSAIIRN